MAEIYVSIGSNIDRAASVRLALRVLSREFGQLRISPIYECPAVGFEGEPFFNLVVAFSSHLPPAELVQHLDDIERECGRTRYDQRMASRRIDLDLLLYGDLIDHDDNIRVPRADILAYAFVLKPLRDLAPNIRHPENKQTMAELWERFDQAALSLREVDEEELHE
jgi:2-amino-4-hydroxy-6-hydroxymethyldihydropteridine diphosphokinase